jgi:H/ACA ribonucleoprotein complex subunit 4
MVTGVLPIALNRACRLSDYFMHKNKTYVGIMRVHKDIERKELEKEISNFIGKIMQLPPVKSRVKREIREREVFSFKILEIEGKDVLFETEVQAGTYIRKLCSDLGDRIGGAHMLELRRIKAGIFSEENIVNLYDFEKAVESWKKGDETQLRKILIPADKAIKKVLPIVEVKQELIKQLLTGKPLMKKDIKIGKEKKFAIFSQDKFIGVYRKVDEGEITARAEFVFN